MVEPSEDFHRSRCLIIPVGNTFALIDAEDLWKIEGIDWSLSHGYAHNKVRGYLHQVILDYFGENDIDHKNHDELDCTKDNLRIVSRTINNLNRRIVDGTKMRTLATGAVVWDARIQFMKKSFHLGTFKTKKRAQVFVERARKDLIEGSDFIYALKRKHRWSNLEKVKLDAAA